MELTAELYRQESFKIDKNSSIHSPPLINYFPHIGYESNIDANEVSLVHLNGIAGGYFDSRVGSLRNIFEHKSRARQEIYEILTSWKENTADFLTFAWEVSGRRSLQRRFDFAEALAVDTNILIIIGYSFPFFNRNIDKTIFNSLKKNNSLKKIYFQDPFLDGSFLRGQFDLDSSIEIIHVNRVDSFFVPNEL